jgi:glycosyltransferase involved in cell wall biosynthesis
LNKKLLIIQGELPHYRIPVFESIGKLKGIDLTIAHSKKPTNNLHYKEIIIPEKKIISFHLQAGLLELIKSFDVVIGMFNIRWLSIIQAQFFCKRNSIPFIWWGHGMGQSMLFQKIRLFLVKRADALLLYDIGRAKPFIEGGIPKEKIFEAPNTLYISNFGYDPSIKRDSFLFVGRLYKEKQVDELIKAFAYINKKDRQPFSLKIVGEGAERNYLEALVKDLGIDKEVQFLGKITDDEKLKKIYFSSLAYVSPGVIGLSVLHSFAYGVPVVTCEGKNHGPEYLNLTQQNSIVYEGAAEELSEIMQRFIVDSGLSCELGKNAYEFYKNKRQVKDMVQGFKSALEYAKKTKIK